MAEVQFTKISSSGPAKWKHILFALQRHRIQPTSINSLVIGTRRFIPG